MFEQSMMSENYQLNPRSPQLDTTIVQQTHSESPEVHQKRPSLLRALSRKSTIGKTIKINYGAGATQDPLYKFQDNTVRTTK